MEKRQTLSFLFYLRRDKATETDKIPVYMRITVNQKRAEMAVQRYVDPGKWSHEAGKLKGTKKETKDLNDFLELLRRKV